MRSYARTSIFDTVNYAVCAFFALVAFIFFASRLSIVVTEYRVASAELKTHIAMRERCVNDPGLRADEPQMCSRRTTLSYASPVAIAVQTMLLQTHSCGNVSCSELLWLLTTNFGAIVYYLFIALVALMFVWWVMARAVQPMAMGAVRFHGVDHAAYYGQRLEHQPVQHYIDYHSDEEAHSDRRRGRSRSRH